MNKEQAIAGFSEVLSGKCKNQEGSS